MEMPYKLFGGCQAYLHIESNLYEVQDLVEEFQEVADTNDEAYLQYEERTYLFTAKATEALEILTESNESLIVQSASCKYATD